MCIEKGHVGGTFRFVVACLQFPRKDKIQNGYFVVYGTWTSTKGFHMSSDTLNDHDQNELI